MTDTKMELIAKLLKQAEGAGTEAEADTFMEKAERLAATYSIDLAVARQHTAQGQRPQPPVQRDIRIGTQGKLINKGLCSLFFRIAQHYNVKIDVAHNNTYVVAYGFPTDVDLVEAMFASLSVQMIDAKTRYMRSRDWEGESYWDEKTGWYKDVSARGAGQSFNLAFADRIGQRIKERVRQVKQEMTAASAPTHPDTADTASPNGGASTALAIRRAEVEVQDFHHAHSRARGRWQGSQVTSRRAVQAGRTAGDNARLGGERAIGGHRTAINS